MIILERGMTPFGASTRNAGFSCIGSISEHLADIRLTSLETVLKRISRRWSGLETLKAVMGKEAMDYLIRFANERLMLPKGWEIEQEWSGIMGMTPNKEPIIEEVKPGVWAAAGLSGMGIAIGMQVAQEVEFRISNN